LDWFIIPFVIGLLLLSLFAGMRIAFCMALVGTALLYFEGGTSAFADLGYTCWNSINSFVLLAAPLFLLMGNIIIYAGIADQLYGDLTAWVHRVPGRLLVSNILSCSIFAAISGSSVATAATISQIALPAQRARGYNMRLVYGSLAAGGTLGILIPPSLNMIVYGSVSDTSVAKLFVAGIAPGIVLTALFVLFVVIYSLVKGGVVPDTAESYTWRDRMVGFRSIAPVALLIGAVLGTIYFGIATPTEAAAIGVCGSLLLAIAYRRLTWKVLRNSFGAAAQTTTWILFLIMGANILSFALGRVGITQRIVEMIVTLSIGKMGILIVLIFLYLVLGCLIDPLSMLFLTAPIAIPVLKALGYDLIWFGILYVVLAETGMITPPVGLNLFTLQGIAKAPMDEVVRGIIPYFFLLMLMILIMIVFPEMVLWLPNRMGP
jgi:tripartite ATP-independent transporter DctM subunit